MEAKLEESLAMKVRSKLNFLAASRLTDLGQRRRVQEVGPTPEKAGRAGARIPEARGQAVDFSVGYGAQ